MIRDVATSVFRFSWAMGMLGVDQAANLLDRERGWQRGADSLDAVSSVATEHLGPTARRLYEAGDRLQSGLVDSAMSAARGMTGRGGLGQARDRFEHTMRTLRHDLDGSGGSPPYGSDPAESHRSEPGPEAAAEKFP